MKAKITAALLLALTACTLDDEPEHRLLLQAKINGGTEPTCFSVTAPEDIIGDYCLTYLKALPAPGGAKE